MKLFYQRLKTHREQKGIRVSEMAKLLGVSVSTYRDWEYGRKITGEPYVLMASILQISINELLTGDKGCPIKITRNLEVIKFQILELERELSSFLLNDNSFSS